jgi:hypothetical protein
MFHFFVLKGLAHELGWAFDDILGGGGGFGGWWCFFLGGGGGEVYCYFVQLARHLLIII